MQTFEQYLQEIHAEIFPQILDDDLSDHFDDWLSELDGEGYIKWAESYGKKLYLRGGLDALNKLK